MAANRLLFLYLTTLRILLSLRATTTASEDAAETPPSLSSHRKLYTTFGGIRGTTELQCGAAAVDFGDIHSNSQIDTVWGYKKFLFGERLRGSTVMTLDGGDGHQYEIEAGHEGAYNGPMVKILSGGSGNNLMLQDGIMYGLTRDGSKVGGAIALAFPTAQSDFGFMLKQESANEEIALSTYFYDEHGGLMNILANSTTDIKPGYTFFAWKVTDEYVQQKRLVKAVVFTTYNMGRKRFSGLGIRKIFTCIEEESLLEQLSDNNPLFERTNVKNKKPTIAPTTNFPTLSFTTLSGSDWNDTPLPTPSPSSTSPPSKKTWETFVNKDGRTVKKVYKARKKKKSTLSKSAVETLPPTLSKPQFERTNFGPPPAKDTSGPTSKPKKKKIQMMTGMMATVKATKANKSKKMKAKKKTAAPKSNPLFERTSFGAAAETSTAKTAETPTARMKMKKKKSTWHEMMVVMARKKMTRIR